MLDLAYIMLVWHHCHPHLNIGFHYINNVVEMVMVG